MPTFSDSGPLRLDDKKLQPPDTANFEHEWDHFGSIKGSSAQIVRTFSDSGPLRLDDKELQPQIVPTFRMSGLTSAR